LEGRNLKSLDVAVIQTSPVFGEARTNLHDAINRIPPGCDLAVLPELFATGYQFQDRAEALSLAEPAAPGLEPGYAVSRLQEVSADTGTTLVAGICERAGQQLFNSAVLVRPDRSREIYRKVHLFQDEKDIFDPGDLGFPVFRACGTTIGLMVCYDWIYPEASRSLALAGARLICHPANLVLPFCPDAMITRSLENRVFTLTANRVGREMRTDQPLEFIGLSQIVSPRGELLAQATERSPATARARITLADNHTMITPRNELWGDRRPDQYQLD
jgi:predicted amidohydrolase